jgi:hypothetical protein
MARRCPTPPHTLSPALRAALHRSLRSVLTVTVIHAALHGDRKGARSKMGYAAGGMGQGGHYRSGGGYLDVSVKGEEVRVSHDTILTAVERLVTPGQCAALTEFRRGWMWLHGEVNVNALNDPLAYRIWWMPSYRRHSALATDVSGDVVEAVLDEMYPVDVQGVLFAGTS